MVSLVNHSKPHPEPRPYFEAEVKHYTDPQARSEILIRMGNLTTKQYKKVEQVIKDLKLDDLMFGDKEEMDITLSNASQAYGLFAALKAVPIEFRNPYKTLLGIQQAVKDMDRANRGKDGGISGRDD